MSYSKDYKECAVKYRRENHTYEETRKIFGMSKSTYYAWEKEYDAGFPEKLKRTCEKKIDKETLKRAVEERPDSELWELAEPFNCTPQAVFYALRRMGITLKKKTFTYSEKSEEEREEYLKNLEKVPEEKRVYVDESGCSEYFGKTHGRAPRGVKVEDTKRGRRYARTNVIAGRCIGEILAPKTYIGTTNSAFFENWFEYDLLSIVPCGYTIIMDNAGFHRKKILLAIAERYGVHLLFLPAYSPDFNPIEKFWANLKNWLRKNIASFANLSLAILGYCVRFLC